MDVAIKFDQMSSKRNPTPVKVEIWWLLLKTKESSKIFQCGSSKLTHADKSNGMVILMNMSNGHGQKNLDVCSNVFGVF